MSSTPLTAAVQTAQIFLSYSHTDRPVCIALRSALEQAGLSVFRDEDALRVGDRWISVCKRPCKAVPHSFCWWGATGLSAGSGPRRRSR